MKAVCYMNAEKEPVLVETDVERPEAGAGEVLVEVRAAGVTPTELTWYPTYIPRMARRGWARFPGMNLPALWRRGSGATDFAVGDEVTGSMTGSADGATAEYCVTATTVLANKPKKLTFAEAAAVPIGALTAWQGLVDRAQVKAGQRVLVHGAAGAVGVFVVQIARLKGAEVIATAAARKRGVCCRAGREHGN